MLFHSLSGPEAHGVIDEMDRRAKSEAPAISSAIDRGDTETVGASPAGTPRGSTRRGNPWAALSELWDHLGRVVRLFVRCGTDWPTDPPVAGDPRTEVQPPFPVAGKAGRKGKRVPKEISEPS